MKRSPWQKSSPELLDAIRALLADRYPTLHVYVERVVVVRGTFPVVHEGRELDRYQVEILFPDGYPDRVPIVFETGGRIPHHVDWHVFPRFGNACLFVSEDRWAAWPRGATFEQFLEGPVRNYFLSQTHYRLTGRWPEGWEPRSHNLEGVLEAYHDLLGTADRQEVLRYMWAMSHDVVKGHWLCPCGSGEKIRRCHRDRIGALQARVPADLVRLRFQQYQGLEDTAREAYFR